jgi:hypothetical protein
VIALVWASPSEATHRQSNGAVSVNLLMDRG